MRGFAQGVAVAALCACSHDFGSFHVGDGGAPLDAPRDSQPPPDGSGTGDASKDVIIDVSSECTPDQGCLNTATQCTAGCVTTYTNCVNGCSNQGCRMTCATMEGTCKQSCQTNCNLCEQTTGCPDTTGCASVTM